MRLARAAAILILAAAPAVAAAAPARVVSMNLCTDQLAMLLARPGQLAGVSRVAGDPVASALWREAAGFPAVPAEAEAIHRLAPDLVVAGAWDPPATLAMLRRLGIPVETFAIESSFDDIRANVTRMGDLLGNPEGAAALIAGMDAALAVPPPPGPPPSAALYYANGYTSGEGTLADAILTAAGFANVADALGITGLAPLPLERLVLAAPDLIVTGQAYASPALAEGVLTHPALRELEAGRAAVADNLWVCGTPLAAGAVAALRAARPE
jgi:iron complex transport system substrate-binding protein